jgi:hypothetical protein
MIYINDKPLPLKIDVPMPTDKTRQVFEGWERSRLIRFIDGTCDCAYCELAREIIRNREKQLRFY